MRDRQTDRQGETDLGVRIGVVPPHVEVLVGVEDVVGRTAVVLQVGPELPAGHLKETLRLEFQY